MKWTRHYDAKASKKTWWGTYHGGWWHWQPSRFRKLDGAQTNVGADRSVPRGVAGHLDLGRWWPPRVQIHLLNLGHFFNHVVVHLNLLNMNHVGHSWFLLSQSPSKVPVSFVHNYVLPMNESFNPKRHVSCCSLVGSSCKSYLAVLGNLWFFHHMGVWNQVSRTVAWMI